jgi:hypothetical protein
MAPVFINALQQMLSTFDRSVGERKLFAVHAVRYLCQCQKDRSSDEMVNWIMHSTSQSDLRPVIPDYALDMHTVMGKRWGAGANIFGRRVPKSSQNCRDVTRRISKEC